jgi:hypothetical protein
LYRPQADNRFARTQPAEPAPTMMKSNCMFPPKYHFLRLFFSIIVIMLQAQMPSSTKQARTHDEMMLIHSNPLIAS